MESTNTQRLPTTLISVMCALLGCVIIWYSFQRKMCSMTLGKSCGPFPNVVYFVPGVVLLIFSLGIILYFR